MDASVTIDVTTLDLAHRRALEDVIGTRLHEGQRLVIGVTQSDRPTPGPVKKPTLDDWAKVYEGLTEQQIEEIDRIAKTRADLTRNAP